MCHVKNLDKEKGVVVVDTDTLTGERVWERLADDPRFVNFIAPETRDAWRQFCNRLCQLTETHQRLPLDGRTLVFLRREVVVSIRNDWLRQLCSTEDHNHMEMLLDAEFRRLCGQLDLISQLQDWEPLHDEIFLADEEDGGLSFEAAEHWRKHGMTVAELLLMQPSALIAMG